VFFRCIGKFGKELAGGNIVAFLYQQTIHSVHGDRGGRGNAPNARRGFHAAECANTEWLEARLFSMGLGGFKGPSNPGSPRQIEPADQNATGDQTNQ
jgi:hypothetical protein